MVHIVQFQIEETAYPVARARQCQYIKVVAAIVRGVRSVSSMSGVGSVWQHDD